MLRTSGQEAAPARWNHSLREVREAGQSCPDTVEEALRVAYTVTSHLAPQLGHRKLARLVRAYLAERKTNQSFGDWVIAYADPTGETAVPNVMFGGDRR